MWVWILLNLLFVIRLQTILQRNTVLFLYTCFFHSSCFLMLISATKKPNFNVKNILNIANFAWVFRVNFLSLSLSFFFLSLPIYICYVLGKGPKIIRQKRIKREDKRLYFTVKQVIQCHQCRSCYLFSSYQYIITYWSIGPAVRVFTNGPGDQGSSRVNQRLKKWYLMSPRLALSIIRYGLKVKWINPGKGVTPSPTPRCRSC